MIPVRTDPPLPASTNASSLPAIVSGVATPGMVADDALFSAILAGAHVENAAVASGMSIRTAYRRLADPKFRRQVEAARAAIRDQVIGKLAEAATDAVNTLWDLLNDADSLVRLKAAKEILDVLARFSIADEATRRHTTSTTLVHREESRPA